MPVRVQDHWGDLRNNEKIVLRLSNLKTQLQELKIEADTLEEARRQVLEKKPFDSAVFSEEVISDGKSKTIKATGDTSEEALRKAQTQLPNGALIIRETELTRPNERQVTVSAFNENEAIATARQSSHPGEIVRACREVDPGKRGFLGFGRKPARFEVTLFQNAIVEIVTRGKASICISFGKKEVVEEIHRLDRTISDLRYGQALFKSGAPESRASSSPISSRRY